MPTSENNIRLLSEAAEEKKKRLEKEKKAEEKAIRAMERERRVAEDLERLEYEKTMKIK